jgi:hypothetical protein
MDDSIIKKIIEESKGIEENGQILPPQYLKNQIFHESPIQKRKRLKMNPKYSPHQSAREMNRRISKNGKTND